MRSSKLPVLPVGLYVSVGRDGIGVELYREWHGDFEVLRFQYLYVGLPALDALEYLERDSALAVALSALMKVPKEKRAWLKAEALERLARRELTEQKRYLLSDCVQTYLVLGDPADQKEFEALLARDEYLEAKTMAVTFYEQGLQQGLQQGRKILLVLIEERFGPLSDKVRQRVEEWPGDELPDLGRRVLHAESLKDLGLEDET